MPLTLQCTFTRTKVNKSKIEAERALLPNISMSLCIVSSKNGKNCSWTRTFSIKLKSTHAHIHCTVYNYVLSQSHTCMTMLYTANLHTCIYSVNKLCTRQAQCSVSTWPGCPVSSCHQVVASGQLHPQQQCWSLIGLQTSKTLCTFSS
jgi:hypothetical protein